jgi:hypothetical protein
VIKSGGEWISSVQLENAAIGHPAVLQAAVIAIAHPKWQERPLLLVMRKAGAQVSAAELMEHLSDKVAKWWLPDAIEFVDQLPMTATGKVHKLTLPDTRTIVTRRTDPMARLPMPRLPPDIVALRDRLDGFKQVIARHERHAALLDDERRLFTDDGLSPGCAGPHPQLRRRLARRLYGMCVPTSLAGRPGMLAWFGGWGGSFIAAPTTTGSATTCSATGRSAPARCCGS